MKLNVWTRVAFALCLGVCSLAPSMSRAQDNALEQKLAAIQTRWAQIQYKVPEKERESQFSALGAESRQFAAEFPDRAESHAWNGIVLSSWGGAKGGLGALGLVKEAKAEYEKSIAVDPRALDGSALSSLAVLYAKVPGWPIGFGDNDKAEELFKEALSIKPTSIDTNYFYADYLISRKRFDEARHHLDIAAKAPARPGRELADQGRRNDIRELAKKLPQ